ncbi:MAG: hypothetical protein ABI720_11875 [Actinomycetes bacterium]
MDLSPVAGLGGSPPAVLFSCNGRMLYAPDIDPRVVDLERRMRPDRPFTFAASQRGAARRTLIE